MGGIVCGIYGVYLKCLDKFLQLKKKSLCKHMSGNQWSSSLIERLDLKINTLTM